MNIFCAEVVAGAKTLEQFKHSLALWRQTSTVLVKSFCRTPFSVTEGGRHRFRTMSSQQYPLMRV